MTFIPHWEWLVLGKDKDGFDRHATCKDGELEELIKNILTREGENRGNGKEFEMPLKIARVWIGD